MFSKITSAFMLTTVLSVVTVFGLFPMVHAVPATEMTYPEKIFADGKARFYNYKTDDGVIIRYFILKSSDGVIRAAFDACDVCWRENKGYAQQGDFMVCKNCGRRFPSARINEVRGGCNPAPLNRKVENGAVIILVSDILRGKSYFDFGGGR